MSKRVAVLMGGRSAEREVSLVSGNACAAGLRQKGYDVEVIDVTDDMGALLAGSWARMSWRMVVPVRGIPMMNTGLTILCSAISGKRLLSSM